MERPQPFWTICSNVWNPHGKIIFPNTLSGFPLLTFHSGIYGSTMQLWEVFLCLPYPIIQSKIAGRFPLFLSLLFSRMNQLTPPVSPSSHVPFLMSSWQALPVGLIQYTNVNWKCKLDAVPLMQPYPYYTGRHCHFPQPDGYTLANTAIQAFIALRVFCRLVFKLIIHQDCDFVFFCTKKAKGKKITRRTLRRGKCSSSVEQLLGSS